QGESLEDYSMRVAETWKLGRKEADDGVLLLIARDDRKIRIEVGYGLEGVLTDLDSRRIIDNLMTPAFRSGNYGSGVEAAVNAISGAIRGEAGAIPVTGSAGETPADAKLFVSIFALVMTPFTAMTVAIKGRQWWTLYLFLAPFFYMLPLIFGETIALVTLALWLILIPLLRSIWPEKWSIEAGAGSGSSGSGGGGGFSSGGGFSGGGGSFGGGGASGGW
ncbi:MAG: TPM domain-containing protein, partial [Pseudomonadota bacterium]